MPNPLNSVQTADDYTDAATISFIYNSPGGTFDIQNANVFYKLQYLGKGMEEYTPEVLSRPGAGIIQPPAVGIAFRSAVTGTPATVSAFMAAESQPFAIVAATASATPGITGTISSAGAIVHGTGFTVVHNSAGNYTVTFSPTLSGVPDVQVTVIDASGSLAAVLSATPTASSFTVLIFRTGTPFTGIDAAFNFTAVVGPQ